MMTVVEVDPEQQAVLIEQAKEEARRQAATVIEQAAQDPEQQREWIQQNNLIYGGLIAIGLVLVQPFLTVATPTLNWSAKVCAIAFSVAIPLLAALILVSRQETFRRRATDSLVVRATRAVAQLLAFVGVVAGFWHIVWIAGVGILVSGVVAMMVHSAGYFRLELAAGGAGAAEAEAASPGPGEPPATDHAEEQR